MANQKDLNSYIDSFGFVCKKQPPGSVPLLEGGDTCANEGTLFYCDAARIGPVARLFKGPIPVRHPDPSMWYSNTTRTSRDQLIPIMCCFIKAPKLFKSLRNGLFLQHLKHLLLFAFNIYPNWVDESKAKFKVPDFTGPEFWALWIRAFRCWPLYPLLILFDLETLFSIIYTKFFRKTDYDLRNSALVVHAAANYMPTPVSLLTKLIAGNEMFLTAFQKFWGDDPSEPPIDQYISKLYK